VPEGVRSSNQVKMYLLPGFLNNSLDLLSGYASSFLRYQEFTLRILPPPIVPLVKLESTEQFFWL